MNDRKDPKAMGTAASIVSSVLFGVSFLFVKESVSSVSAFTLLSWRFIIAFLAMSALALTGVLKIDLGKKDIRPLIAIAVFQPLVYFTGEVFGIKLTTVAESGTVMACIPIVTIILGILMLHERPTRLQAVSVIASVAGVIIVILVKGLTASFNLLGYLLLFIAILGDGLYVIFSSKASAYTSAEKTYVMAALGAAVFTLLALIEHALRGTLLEFITLPFCDMNFLFTVLYLSLGCSVAAFLLINYSIGALGTTRAASFAGLSTIVSVLGGVFALKEGFSLVQGVGTALVLAGVYGANRLPDNAVPLKEPDGPEAEGQEPENTED